jgi:peptide/nickel transport system permease protein
MSLWRLSARRILTIVPIVLGVTVVTFLLSQVIPADPAAAIAGDSATDEQVEAIRSKLGLGQPIWLQYVAYLGRLVRGDLGTSLFSGRPVASDLGAYFMATLELATAGILIALVVGSVLGVLAAVHKDRWIDHGSRVFALLGAALPVFWLGLLLVLVFYSILGWLPGTGRYSLDEDLPRPMTQLLLVDSLLQGKWSAFGDAAAHLALPALTLGIMGAGVIARVTRSSMLDVMGQEYMRAARAKGMSRRRMLYLHGLRNALLPTITVAGLTYGSLLGGAVLTESIFNWPGLGRYAVAAMFRQDYPALMGVVIVMTIAYAVVNLMVDLVYVLLNPVIRS